MLHIEFMKFCQNHWYLVYRYTLCVRGMRVWCSGPQKDKQLPQKPLTGQFFQVTTFCNAFYESYGKINYLLGSPQHRRRLAGTWGTSRAPGPQASSHTETSHVRIAGISCSSLRKVAIVIRYKLVSTAIFWISCYLHD